MKNGTEATAIPDRMTGTYNDQCVTIWGRARRSPRRSSGRNDDRKAAPTPGRGGAAAGWALAAARVRVAAAPLEAGAGPVAASSAAGSRSPSSIGSAKVAR
jgi:hypothetical protein